MPKGSITRGGSFCGVDDPTKPSGSCDSAELEPHFKTLEILGEALMQLGRFKDAIVPLAAATALNRQVRAPSLLAKALIAVGDRHRAREAARIAAARDPNNRLASEVLAATVDLAEDYDGPDPLLR